MTFAGSPGIGKTHLAIQLGYEALLDFPDGVFLVELASITHSDRVTHAIMDALDIATISRQNPLETLKSYLYERQLLLILDNFEHLLDATSDIQTILATCPLVKILVTSRTVLRIRGEHQLSVPPLDLPARINDMNHQSLMQFSALQLFVTRAKAVHPEFEITKDNATILAAICARLDGLPLAIEIVAAQTEFLQPAEIFEYLKGKSLLEVTGNADSDPRHQTLMATIRWSYQLLSNDEQRFFRALGVFAGDFSLEAIEQLTDTHLDTIVSLSKLIRMNLLKREIVNEHVSRYRLLEIFREFTKQALIHQQEWTQVKEAHAHYFLEFAIENAHHIERNNQIAGLAKFERDHANLQTALDYWIEKQAWANAFQLASALIHFWVYRNHVMIALFYLKSLLSVDCEAPYRATILNGTAMLSYLSGDYPAIIPYAQQALTEAQKIRNRKEMAWAYTTLGMANGGIGNFADAVQLFEAGLSACHEADIPWEHASLLNGLGEVSRNQNQFEQAMMYFHQALEIGERIDNLWLNAHILDNMGHVEYTRNNLNISQTYIRRSLQASQTLGDERGIAMCLEKLGGIALKQRQLERATQLLGSADRLRKAKNTPIEGMDRKDYDAIVASLRSQLSEEDFTQAWSIGYSTPISQVLADFG